MTVHCYISRNGDFVMKKELCFDKYPLGVNPATKEQRELLFAKMKEAGYEWDAEKKELKKIEQKPADWSEEDKRIIDNLISQLGNLFARKLIKEETKDKYVNWLKNLKDRVQLQPQQSLMIKAQKGEEV